MYTVLNNDAMGQDGSGWVGSGWVRMGWVRGYITVFQEKFDFSYVKLLIFSFVYKTVFFKKFIQFVFFYTSTLDKQSTF